MEMKEWMVKDGENISKFSKEAMTLGDDVYAHTGKAPSFYERFMHFMIIT